MGQRTQVLVIKENNKGVKKATFFITSGDMDE